MGALTDLLLKRRDSPPKPPVHSTLDIPLPPPQPLWALATEPDWASRGGGGQGGGTGGERRSFGPRAPRNVYDDGRSSTMQPQGRERAGTRTRTTSVDDLSGAVHRLDLSQRGGGGGPRTPHKDGAGARSAPPTTAPAGRRREDVYPPFPPAYSYSPTPSPAHPSSSLPQPPPYHAPPTSSPFSSPSSRPPLPPRPSSSSHHSPSASSPLRPPPAPSSSPLRMPEPQHYSLDPSTGAPILVSQSSPFSAPPPPPIPPLPATYPPPPSPPRSPTRLRPDYSPTRSSPSNRGPLPPLPPRETRPALRGAVGSAPPFGLPKKQAVATPSPSKTTGGTTPSRAPFRPSPSSSATYSPSLHSSTTSTTSSSAAASPALSTDGSTSSQDDDEDEDDFLPDPSTVFRAPPPSAARAKAKKGRSVSAPIVSPSKQKEKASSPAKIRTPLKNKNKGEERGRVQVQCAGTTHGNHRCTRFVRLAITPFSQALLSRSSSPGEAAGEDELGVEGKWEDANHYCGQHAKKAVRDGMCVVRTRNAEGDGGERRVRYEDWIPPSLPLQTQALLREYMAKPVSEKDGEGYIYIHELVPSSSHPSSSSSSSPSASPSATATTTTTLKLGRTLHPSLRLSQWRTSCPSREPIVRGIFPRPPRSLTSSSSSAGAPQQQQGVALRFAERGGRWHHRWERLCLIEIAGQASAFASSSSSSSSAAGKKKEEKAACVDCGKKHVECFEVPRAVFTGDWGTRRQEKGTEGQRVWEDWETWDVVEVVERWGRWCSDILG